MNGGEKFILLNCGKFIHGEKSQNPFPEFYDFFSPAPFSRVLFCWSIPKIFLIFVHNAWFIKQSISKHIFSSALSILICFLLPLPPPTGPPDFIIMPSQWRERKRLGRKNLVTWKKLEIFLSDKAIIKEHLKYISEGKCTLKSIHVSRILFTFLSLCRTGWMRTSLSN